MTDGETSTLASRGLVEPFFQLCCCVSFLFWWEIGFGFTYYYILRVSYSCGVMLNFLVLAKIVFGVTYILRVQYSCALVSFLLLWWEVNFVKIFSFNPNFLLFLVLAGNSFWC
jgi:hypothetical protein